MASAGKGGEPLLSLFEDLEKLGITPFEEYFIPFSEDEIEQTEAVIGHALPPDYRSFLLRYGCALFSTMVNCRPSDGPLYFGSFYDYEDQSTAFDNLRETLPDTFLPIGDDGGDIVFCLAVKGDNAGKVFVYNENFGLGDEAEEYLKRGEPVPEYLRREVVREIATSFSQFIKHMEPVPDEDF